MRRFESCDTCTFSLLFEEFIFGYAFSCILDENDFDVSLLRGLAK